MSNHDKIKSNIIASICKIGKKNKERAVVGSITEELMKTVASNLDQKYAGEIINELITPKVSVDNVDAAPELNLNKESSRNIHLSCLV